MIVRLMLIISCLFAVVPTSSFASSDEQLQDCIGALNAIAQAIDENQPHLDSDYVRALYGSVLLDRALQKKEAIEAKTVGDAKDIRNCFAVDIDKKHIELLLKAYHGQLSADPAEDLAYCYAVLSSFELELKIVLGEDVGGLIATKLFQDFGNVYAFVTRLYREPTVWEIERRAAQIRETEAAEKLAESRYICELYSLPVSAVTIAAITTMKASSRTGTKQLAQETIEKEAKRETLLNCDERPIVDGYAKIILSFSGDSWTEISDADGQRLFFEMGRSGRTAELSGRAPLSVLVGNLDNVSMRVNGEDCLISPSSPTSRAARFTLQ